MSKKMSIRWLAMLLAVVLCLGYLQPLSALAADEPGVADYQSFLSNLKVLEQYADEYAAMNSRYNAKVLVVNFIRTGVERYQDDNWTTLAGVEITDFVRYVQGQDAAKGTTAMLLRNIIIDDFTLPNGNQVDFGHMFGTLNIAFVASQESADLGGWAGDICDLLLYSKHYGNVPAGTVEERVAHIKNNCFGVDADDAFGMDDFYGDMDAYYLYHKSLAGEKLSTIMESYFTADLSDSDRAAYFLNNRFRGVKTQEEVRTAIYDAYKSNMGLRVLEAKRELSGESELRAASCYAFADYLFEQAGDRLTGDVGGGGEGDEGGNEGEGPAMDNDYYSVFSSSSSVLAPGIQQTIKYAMTADGKQIVYYVATVDVNRDDVTIMANYRDNDPSKGWGTQRVEDQALALMNKHTNPNDKENYIENFNVVVATNADGYNMSTGQPGGLLVMNGKEWYGVDNDGFFAILKDGSAMIGTKADYATYKDQIQEAVGGFGAVLIRDGEIAVNKTANYTKDRASRTAIGITADGKVVMMVLDGRQEPFSAGGSMEEIAQIMLEAGCVEAINLDGGGSTTYLSKPEGADSLKLVNRPSDGFARSVATSLVAVSTAKSSKEFDHANITSDYNYLTIGTELKLVATGVSNTGNAAALPEGLTWEVSDSTIGSVSADGVFTALANGEVKVHLVKDGVVVGTKVLYVVVPDALSFAQERMTAIFGVPQTIPVVATYNGNPVAFTENDVMLALTNFDAGTVEGFVFTADPEMGIRNVQIGALLMADMNVFALADVTIYKDGESVFDFDKVTAGDRNLAWDRVVSNSSTPDGYTYLINEAGKSMEISYVFGMDMQAIQIPEKLASLTHMLPGADVNSTAWSFLLQLAERVSVLTEVTIKLQLDKNLAVDISNISVVNDYFYMKSASVDENNLLTLVCGWYDQTQPIDPATANPICILNGIKAVPKADASWNNNQLTIVNTGDVSYNIFLRANALYSFAIQPENQAEFDLHPFINPDNPNEKGASFGSTYATFTDSFVLDKSLRQGWEKVGDYYRYFVDNEALVGIHYLPSLEDPSIKLFYEFEEDGVLNGTVTGLVVTDDGVYYAYQGEKMTGWRSVMDATGQSYDYYFHPTTGKAVNGEYAIYGHVYTFENYKLVKGALVKDSGGTHYLWAGRYVRNQWVEIDGKYYFAQYPVSGYFATGGLVLTRDIDGKSSHYHLFDENGALQTDYNGLYHVGNDTYLLKNGVRQSEPGLVYLDGYYYYFCSTDKAVKNTTYWPSKTNGLLPMGPYKFDEQGRMINPPSSTPSEPENPNDPPAPAKNGVVEVNGKLYYYINDALQYGAGLVKLEDGSYIYVRSSGELAIGSYWVTNVNGLMNQGMYTFGEDGKMVLPEEPETPEEPSEPTVPSEPSDPSDPPAPPKNGVVEEDGKLYYYVDGKLQHGAGLVKLADGSYIYVRSNGQLAVGQYWITATNGLMGQGIHTFDASGIMIDPPSDEPTTPEEQKNGIVEMHGSLYFYENGKIVYGAGLVEMASGGYIYVRSNGQLAVGQYWITATNGLLKQGMYNFGEDGIMTNPPTDEPQQPENPTEPEKPEVKNGIVNENGVLYYYNNGAVAYGAGLMKLADGSYIYVRSNGKLAVGQYWVTVHNDLVNQGMYTFGEDGLMVNPPVDTPDEPEIPENPENPTEPEKPAVKNGIVEENGTLRYYVNGALAYGAGLVKLTDENGVDFYIYVRSGGELATGKYWPTTMNNLLPCKMYDFGTNGRLYL